MIVFFFFFFFFFCRILCGYITFSCSFTPYPVLLDESEGGILNSGKSLIVPSPVQVGTTIFLFCHINLLQKSCLAKVLVFYKSICQYFSVMVMSLET